MSDSTQLVPVQFHGDTLEAVRDGDDVWVALRRLCDNLGVTMQGQLAKLKEKGWACVKEIFTHDSSGRTQSMAVVHLRAIPGWLFSINAGKVRPEVREKLVRYQQECADVLADHFLGKRGRQDDPLAAVVPVLTRIVDRIESMEDRIAELSRPTPTDETVRHLRYLAERMDSREAFIAEREARLARQMEAVGRMLAVPAARPVRMTREEKQRAVEMALKNPAFDGLGDGEAAARLGVSESMYRKYRRAAQRREEARGSVGGRFRDAYESSAN